MKKNTLTDNSSTSMQASIKILSPTPRSLPFLIKDNKNEPLISSEEIQYLYNEYIPNLALLKKTNYKKVYLVEEDLGFVGGINFDDKSRWLHIKIVDEKGNEVIAYRTAEKNIPYKKFYKLTEGKKIPITYQDIKIGDKITHISYHNLLNPNESYNEYLIESKL